jgi:ATP-dependent DNA helicase DinG
MVEGRTVPTLQELLSNPAHGLVKEARPAQLAMAAAVEQVLRDGGAYFVEAPVATGKTYAYLLPALLAQGKRVVVATAKKQLQDQIVEKDFPALKRILGIRAASMVATPLKGKGTYACQLAANAILDRGDEDRTVFDRFLARSLYGDRADYGGAVPAWWSQATAEDCVGKRCAYFSDCGYIRLKQAVRESQLVVVNHHVLGADMFLGLGKMVGGAYDVLVVDEAHTLAAGIRAAFSHKLGEDSIGQVWELLKRTGLVFPQLRKLLEPWGAMFEAVPDRGFESKSREAPVFPGGMAAAIIENLRLAAGELAKTLTTFGGTAFEDAPEEMPEDIYVDGEPIEAIEVDKAAHAIAVEEENARVQGVLTQAQKRVDQLLRGLSTAQGVVEPDTTITDPEQVEMRRARILANTAIYSTVDDRGRFAVKCEPVSVGGIAGRYLAALKTVVVCSATLAHDSKFEHVENMTGLSPVKAEVLPTSFDYDKQGFVFIPRGLAIPGRKDPEYDAVMRKRVDMAVRLVELSEGGAFILTTANDELDAFATALKQRFPGRTFAQGHRKNPWDGDPNAALAKFKTTRDSVLVGSKSFWEGVDVPGGDLRLVIVAKLPFPHFNDPIIKARERLAGDNAFRDVQLVDMLVDLRQGVGRLIRTRADRGCVAILDSRIWEKGYGGLVRRALPWSNNLVTSDFANCEKILPRYVAYFRRQALAGSSALAFVG